MSNSTLQSKIHDLASEFASGILQLVRGLSLDEILGETKGKATADAPAEPRAKKAGKPGRLIRRSEEDIAKGVASLVELIGSKPEGLRAEQIRVALDLDVRELPRLLTDALASKQITKSGNKRATTYFGSKAKAPKTTKAPKTKAAKKAKAAKTVSVKAGVVKAKAKKAGKAKAAPASEKDAT